MCIRDREQRLGESFKQVADRLEQVHKGLGEMQSLARDVGSLNRVLTNVKTRGVFGEMQLAGLLEQVFTPCLLYTSDAADERSSVDLGGRRIIKKKKNKREQWTGDSKSRQ